MVAALPNMTARRLEIPSAPEEMVELRREMVTVREDLKRHIDVWVETLRGDLRALAHGIAALSTKIDSLTPPRA